MKGKLNKKIIIIVIAVAVICGGIYVGTTYSNAMTLDEAKNVAVNFVPESATLVESEDDDGEYELSYRDSKSGKSYEVVISKKDKAVKEFTVKRDAMEGGVEIKISEDQVKKNIKDEFGSVTEIKVDLDEDDGLYSYDVNFKAPDYRGEAEVNAETGVIVESTLKYGKAVTVPLDDMDDDDDDDDSDAASAEIITEQEAKDIVLAKIPGAVIDYIKLDTDDDDVKEYEGQATLGDYEYDFEINAASGVIINFEKELKDNDIDDK